MSQWQATGLEPLSQANGIDSDVTVGVTMEQIVAGDAVAVTFGVVPTEIVTLTVFEQPLEFVPVTE